MNAFRKLNSSDKALVVVCHTVLIIFFVLILFPVLNLVAISMSASSPTLSGRVGLWPVGFNLEAYAYILSSSQFFVSLRTSLLVTVVGSLSSLVCSTMAAYPLSKRDLPGRKWVLFAFTFTMMFSGGLIPTYLLMQKLRLINNLMALIFPSLISVYNMLILKNYFEAMPEAIEESAEIDGANRFTTLLNIVLPLAKPVLATVFMFFVVGYWNSYFDAKIYITDRSKMTLQVYLQTVIFESKDPTGDFALTANSELSIATPTVINATVVCAIIPMVILYPALQQFFVKGTMIGSVKQ